jgi:predicted SAM-dependent methyltransferase
MSRLATTVKSKLATSGLRLETVRNLRHELHLVRLGLSRRFSPRRRRQAAALRRLDDVKVHFGCGSRILPDWVNLDAYASSEISMELDLQGPLPLSDGSVRWIFTEHVLEHIDRPRIHAIFSEFHRILKPGGVARILVPDLDFYCRAYVDSDHEAITTAVHRSRTAAEGINSLFNDHFHRFIYDFDTMKLDLEEAGFEKIVHCRYGESEHDGLALDSDLASRRDSTLCVEATRS